MKKIFLLWVALTLACSLCGQETIKTVDSLVTLLSRPPSKLGLVETLGGVTNRDGRGGTFWYDPTSTIATNAGMVFKPASGVGRWLRDYNDQIEPIWFGADPTGTFDSAPAIQAAIDFAADPTYDAQLAWGNLGYIGLGVPIIGTFITSNTLVLHGAIDLHGVKSAFGINDFNQSACIHSKHGGHCISWDQNDDEGSGSVRVPTIRDLQLIGYSEGYATTKPISAVTSRLSFRVLTADAPSALDVIPEYAANNAVIFYDNQTAFLGTARVASVVAFDGTTSTITLEPETDVYSSVNGSAGNLLRAGLDKVAFAPMTHAEDSIPGGINGFVDPSQMGSCGIFLKNTHPTRTSPMPRLHNLYISKFTVGIRVGPRFVGGGGANDIGLSRNRFAGWCFPHVINTTDTFFTGFQYITGNLGADYWSPYARTNTYDQPELRHSPYGVFNFPTAAKVDSMLVEECSYAAFYTARTTYPTIGHLNLDGVIRYGLVLGPGYYGYAAPSTPAQANALSIGRLFVRGPLDGNNIDSFHADSAAIKWESTYATTRSTFVDIGELKVMRGGVTPSKLSYVADLGPISGNNNRLTVLNLSELNGALTFIKPGSKPISFEAPMPSIPADAYTGWYVTNTTRGLAFLGTSIMEISPAGITAGLSSLTTPALALTGGFNGSAVQTWDRPGVGKFGLHFGTDALRLVDERTPRDMLTILSSSLVNQFYWGGIGSGTPRNQTFLGELAVGTDVPGGYFDILASGGTGNASTKGELRFWTHNAGASGATAQTAVQRFGIKKLGQVRFVPIAADPVVGSEDGDFWANSTTKRLRFALNAQAHTVEHWTARIDLGTTVTVLPSDTLVSVANGSPVTINLPVGINNQRYAVKNMGAGIATLTPNGSETLFLTTSLATYALPQGAYVLLQFAGGAPGTWMILNAATGALSVFIGDSGSGGVAGIVPAPSAGDTAANKFLKANGLWTTVSGGGGLADGDYTDITVSGGSTILTIDPGAVTLPKMANMATKSFIGRTTASSGVPEVLSAPTAWDVINSAEVSVASASTTDLGAVASDKVSITGTTTITSFGTAPAGVVRNCRVDFGFTIQAGANLLFPASLSGNILTQTGDRFVAHSQGAGNWIIVSYTKYYMPLNYGFIGATGIGPGSLGYVPIPATGQQGYYLRGDSTWQPTTAVVAGANPSVSAGLTAVNGSAVTYLRSDGAPALDQGIVPTWTASHVFSKAGALSLPAVSVTGVPIASGGTATTTKPLFLIETAGATSTAWPTTGTMLGINAPSGFAGRPIEIQINGVSYFSVTAGGSVSSAGSFLATSQVQAGAASFFSCNTRARLYSPVDSVWLLTDSAGTAFTRLDFGVATSAGPALGRSGTTLTAQLADGTSGGTFAVSGNFSAPNVSGQAVLVGGTKVVTTTLVTANTRILLTGNTDGGTPGWQRVSARTAGTSFTITSSSGTDTSTVAWLMVEP